ncbi:GNAT family N-acetyltransferase [Acidisoma silvae]|uniref:GNAT family N-acetyltransferase n=1 Tax=Acidisoma silvae TaxID=2802396 RepID=A0A963YWC5_9PROT|nr:GNAT family N-acetyltransferase [Acidisoma silvae]MCB8878186.1 GNAT family N-acetyltransferase [Acidisoma silvae]
MKVHAVLLTNGYVISDDRAKIDMAFVHRSLATAYWAMNRPPAVTERSMANCLCFGIYAPPGEQVGFARVLTDYALRAHLADVFIEPALRGCGLGKALIERILTHPELLTVTHWTLTTADAQGLYARYGFHPSVPDGKWMTMERSPRLLPEAMTSGSE